MTKEPISSSSYTKVAKWKEPTIVLDIPLAYVSKLLDTIVDFMEKKSMTFKMVHHATFTDGSEYVAFEVKGKINKKLERMIIEYPFLDFHFFLSRQGDIERTKLAGDDFLSSKEFILSRKTIFDAPRFRLPIGPIRVTMTKRLFDLTKDTFTFPKGRVSLTVPEKIWKFYSEGKFTKAYRTIVDKIKRIDSPVQVSFFTLWAARVAEEMNKKEIAVNMYEKAASLLGKTGNQWLSYFCLNESLRLQELRALTIKTKESEETLQIPFRPPLPSFDFRTFRVLLDKVYNAKTNEAKKESLEKLTSFLFNNIDKGISVLANIRTTTEEIDLLLKNESSEVFWQRLNSPILVECKNWSRPVGTKTLRDFVGKMETQGVKAGIFVSKSRISRNSRFILKEQRSKGRYIVLLDGSDLKEIANGKSPIEKIREKYYSLFAI